MDQDAGGRTATTRHHGGELVTFSICTLCGQHHPEGMAEHRTLEGEWCVPGEAMNDEELANLRRRLASWRKEIVEHSGSMNVFLEQERLLATIDALRSLRLRDERENAARVPVASMVNAFAHATGAQLGTRARVEKVEARIVEIDAENKRLRERIEFMQGDFDAAMIWKERAERAEAVIQMAGNWPQTVGKLEEALSTFPAGREFLKQWSEADRERNKFRDVLERINNEETSLMAAMQAAKDAFQ